MHMYYTIALQPLAHVIRLDRRDREEIARKTVSFSFFSPPPPPPHLQAIYKARMTTPTSAVTTANAQIYRAKFQLLIPKTIGYIFSISKYGTRQ